MMIRLWTALVARLEVLQGARAPVRRNLWIWIGLGLWWAALLLLVLASATRTSRFIYVDF